MGINLQLLGLQAIPRLAKKFNTELKDFLTWPDLYGRTPEEFQRACDNCGEILNHFFEECHVSWWDVYLNSDIGMERMALARDIGLERDDTLMDAGCGRGYFTVAAAKFAEKVVGLDLMNGGGRHGWWSNFKESVAELDLTHKIMSLKADAQVVPLRDCSVSKVVVAHGIRNFQDKQMIQNAIREMHRVLSKDGEMIMAENIPVARNKSQQAHLALYKCKCKYGWGDLFYRSREELLEMFAEVGLKEVHVKIVDYNLSATPPIFYLNPSLLKGKQVEKAQKEYVEATTMIKKYGETSPPVAIIKAAKR